MRPNRRLALALLATTLIMMTPAPTEGARPEAPPPPTILALTEPPDGSVIDPSSRPPTFAFEATPGGRFRVEFSSSNAPFIPTVTSGWRTTAGDRFKPSMNQWRQIVALGAATNTVYWRVIALRMTPDQVAVAPIASFTLAP